MKQKQKIKNKILLFVWIILIAISSYEVLAQSYWVNDTSECPAEYLSQGPVAGKKVCGESGGTVFFYDTDSISAPGTGISTNVLRSSNFGGGYILDCYRYLSPEPYCAPALCNRDSSCNENNTLTNCIENKFSGELGAFTCGDCISGHLSCDSINNNCEVKIGVTEHNKTNTVYGDTCEDYECVSGWGACEGENASIEGCNYEFGVTSCEDEGVPGTWAEGCVCEPLPQESFLTNTLAQGFGDYLLWGNQTKSYGWLINLFTSAYSFKVNETGVFFNNEKLGSGLEGTLGVDQGGTGATTSSGARTNLEVAKIGNCPSGQVVMNTTTSGVQCVEVGTGDGSVTSITAGEGLTGGEITDIGTIAFNTTWGDNRYYEQSAADSEFVAVDGDTMTGNLTLAGDPTDDLHAATKQYVDTASGSGILGSGTANYVTKWTDSDSLGNSVIYDNGTNVGIGTSSPSEKLEVNGSVKSDAFMLGEDIGVAYNGTDIIIGNISAFI